MKQVPSRLRETLLVLGAAGGGGLAAGGIGQAKGARGNAGGGTAEEAASTAEKLAVAQGRGADAMVNYATESLTERVMALTDSKGADVCFDPVGGQLADDALSCPRMGWADAPCRLRGWGPADPSEPAAC